MEKGPYLDKEEWENRDQTLVAKEPYESGNPWKGRRWFILGIFAGFVFGFITGVAGF